MVVMNQATTEWMGETLYRWYIVQPDGHRNVVWSATQEQALSKGQRFGKLGPDATTACVHPAPPAGERAFAADGSGAL